MARNDCRADTALTPGHGTVAAIRGRHPRKVHGHPECGGTKEEEDVTLEVRFAFRHSWSDISPRPRWLHFAGVGSREVDQPGSGPLVKRRSRGHADRTDRQQDRRNVRVDGGDTVTTRIYNIA